MKVSGTSTLSADRPTVWAALNDPDLLAYLGGGALFVGANNYGGWTTLLGLPDGSIQDRDPGVDPDPDIERLNWVLGGTAGFLDARGDLVYSRVLDNVDTADDTMKLPYDNFFTGFAGASFTTFGSLGGDDGVTVFAIRRDSTSTVPEPGLLALMAMAAGVLSRRRVRSRS